MSIYTDMMKYDVYDKELKLSDTIYDSFSLTPTATTELKKIATINTKLGGKVRISFKLHFIKNGKGDMYPKEEIKIVDFEGNIVGESTSEKGRDINIELEVLPFNSYDVMFRSYYDEIRVMTVFGVGQANAYFTIEKKDKYFNIFE